jgi:hypothetical protein
MVANDFIIGIDEELSAPKEKLFEQEVEKISNDLKMIRAFKTLISSGTWGKI